MYSDEAARAWRVETLPLENGSKREWLQGIFSLFHACDSRTHEAALFQNIFEFCTFLPNVSNILPFFALFLKIALMPLLSRISPGLQKTKQKTKI